MNFISHRPLHRRTVLRGLGATLALPFLEAMLPRETQARAPVALPDMSDARYFTSYEPDSDRQCAEYLHTWQPVLFDPRNPSRARFRGGLESSIFQFFVWAALFGVIAIGLAIFRAIRRWLARRSAT